MSSAPLLDVATVGDTLELRPTGSWTVIHANLLEGLFNAVAAIASAAGAIAGGVVADTFGYPAVSLFAAAGVGAALACVMVLSRSSDPVSASV